MPNRLLSIGGVLCAFALLAFTSHTHAPTGLLLKASSNMENPAVQNELNTQSDNGNPGGSPATAPAQPSQPGGQMNAAPQGGNQREQNEIDQEEGK